MNVFFDVLDTILSEEDVPRPHAREVFQELREMGHAPVSACRKRRRGRQLTRAVS